MPAASRLETNWSSAATEILGRSRRNDEATQTCGCRGRGSTKFLASAASNVTLPCWHRQETYSLCLLSERNIVRRLALSLVQWEYLFVCHWKVANIFY